LKAFEEIPRFPGVKSFMELDPTNTSCFTAGEFRGIMKVIRPVVSQLELENKRITACFNSFLDWYQLVRSTQITDKTLIEIDRLGAK